MSKKYSINNIYIIYIIYYYVIYYISYNIKIIYNNIYNNRRACVRVLYIAQACACAHLCVRDTLIA